LEPLKAVAATGQLGTGFKRETIETAAVGARFIGCDAGSTDPGPYYLGSGKTQAADAAVERDLELIIEKALERDIPALIGSAGTGGGTVHLNRTANIVRSIAARRGWKFELATIDSEVAPETVAAAYRSGRLRPLAGAPQLSEDGIRSSARLVAMQGVEPFQHALQQGAQVVIAGRTSDVSIYAAVPLLEGIPPEIAYHAGKILECGAAAVEERMHPDCMTALLSKNEFVIDPPNPAMKCTPQSVAAHGMYENADPFYHVEPGGTLDITNAEYTAASERSVRVRPGIFTTADQITLRLEGAELAGYRTVVVAGVRDPLVVRQIDDFLASTTKVIKGKVRESLGFEEEQYSFTWRVYGKNGSMGELEPDPRVVGREVGLVLDIVAPEQSAASAIASVAWHTALHHPIPQYSGLLSNLAFPFSPPSLDAGPVYRFSINHVIEVENALELAKIEFETL
jgi:hypothetical protein